jgi:hypothetical protein
MKEAIYEGVIGSYSFQMVDDNMIEIWGYDNERPESFIYVKEGSIKTEKDFHAEISYWHINNVN